jgi:hypothetical protein
MQIIKILAKFIEKHSFEWVYIKKDRLIISWNSLQEYVSRYQIKTTLDITTYEEHLEMFDYKLDFVDVWDKMIEWIIIPFDKIKTNFLCNSEVYGAYKDWQNNN